MRPVRMFAAFHQLVVFHSPVDGSYQRITVSAADLACADTRWSAACALLVNATAAHPAMASVAAARRHSFWILMLLPSHLPISPAGRPDNVVIGRGSGSTGVRARCQGTRAPQRPGHHRD